MGPHTDYFYGPIPLCCSLTQDEVEVAYERIQVWSFWKKFERRGLNPVEGTRDCRSQPRPFTWGKNP